MPIPSSPRHWAVAVRVIATVLSALLVPAVSAAAAATAPPIRCTAASPEPVDEQAFVLIGGIQQWVTIKGASCANPVILVIHGGPANTMSPYADALYGGWEKEFTLVQWDQRGAGRTFGRNPVAPGAAEGVLSLELMARDGNELAAYLIEHLSQRKLILFGGSWGSALAVHMLKSRPELFGAYVGTGQLVNGVQNEAASYRQAMALARAAGDGANVAKLEALGAPPWRNPRNPGLLRRITKQYEAQSTTPAPKAWWTPSSFYTTPQMEADYEAGEDYSWLQYVGLQGEGIHSRLDLPKLGLNFDMPVFLIQGELDLVTVPEIAKAYFDSIVAPQKEFVLLPLTGHNPNPQMLEAQYRILKTRVLPLVK
ncbi:alpha/beta hydrolase [soil metagenome]